MIQHSLQNFEIIFAIFIVSSIIGCVGASNNSIPLSYNISTDVGIYDNLKNIEHHVFDYRKNGIRVNVRLVSNVNNSDSEEHNPFPSLPLKDIGYCVIDLSLICMKNKILKYINAIGELDEITLFGSSVKLVKVRDVSKRFMMDQTMNFTGKIDRSIDDFFDIFALRVTLPGWNKRQEYHQIDLMLDNANVVEGRKGGKKGGMGKKTAMACKQMFSCMFMAMKMKMFALVGLMLFKGFMMGSFTMMAAKVMLVMHYMKGGFNHITGGGSGGGDGKLKEIVLLTKGSGGGSVPPPTSSYGVPDVGHGGGWGRSFDYRLPMKINVVQSDDYSQLENSQKFYDSHSSSSVYPEANRGNYLQFTDNQDHESEQFLPTKVEKADKYSLIDKRYIKRAVKSNENFENQYNDGSIIYANDWTNYETIHKFWDNKVPIVATKVRSARKSN